MNPWEILGIEPTDSKPEIMKAYRAKMKEVHPDLHPEDKDATKKAQMLNHALDIVTRPQQQPVQQPQAWPAGGWIVYVRQGYGSSYFGWTTTSNSTTSGYYW